MKPLIGISVNYIDSVRTAKACSLVLEGQDLCYIAGDYSPPVEKAGGIPLLIPQMKDNDSRRDLLERLDGIIISGGADVDPLLYGETNKYSGQIVTERDAQELFMAKYAIENKMPLLAICRGMQMLNVACGGTLYQDLLNQEGAQFSHFGGSYPRNYPWHQIKLSDGTRIKDILGENELMINSFHHQAIKKPGVGCVTSAVSSDGVIEAIELDAPQFAIGVQWHPEMMYDSKIQQKLFKAFIESAGGRI